MTNFKSWLFAVLVLSGISQALPVCNLVFDKCPGNFTSGTITVPESVIWLDPVIPVCTENVQVVTGTNSAPPSIVFIIDNSGSMSAGSDPNATNSDWTDPTEARFRVVTTLLDDIAKASPNAEVGIVSFSRRLQFDYRDNAAFGTFFKTAFPGDATQHDSYIPLTAMNKAYPDGRKGVDTLKALLKYTGHGNLVYGSTFPATRPNNSVSDVTDLRNGTDITLGFEAAKVAMAESKAALGDQYFIFLSDGDPSSIDTPRTGIAQDFQKGIGVPTTFTVFFRKERDTPTAPNSIVTMTTAIKANGYSSSNPRSAFYATNQAESQLLSLLQTSVLNPIFANTPGKATSAVMTVGGSSYNSNSVTTSHFTFLKPVALSGDQTVLDLKYTYQYTDSGVVKSKEVPYILTVKRSGAAPLVPGLTSACREQGTIALFNKGTLVNTVTADHDNLDVRLTLAAGEVCDGCKVEIKPNKTADKENVTLSPGSGFQTGNFGRETTTSVKTGDGKLQHVPTDSIIITYINPDNVLDLIRRAFPYSDVSTALTMVRHNVIARGGDLFLSKPGEDFMLVTPGSLNPTPGDQAKNWTILPGFASPADSQRYVGSVIEASRAFNVDVQIFSNLGEFVNRTKFTISQEEFLKLAKGVKNNTRQLKVLWGGGEARASNGHLAATGAYIIKTTVTLIAIPGIAEDEAVTTDFRRIGVFRHK
ncbi:MAG: VWA domain-containing protein [Fibrobacterota bacterium]|nr:VWA domain-containing protein [Fibrobacterota bacterium]